MSELPSGWESTDFGSLLVQIIGGGTPPKSNPAFFSGPIPFMTVKDLTERFPKDTIDHISQEAVDASSTNIVPDDTLIVATRMSLGKIARPCFATAINQDLKALFLAEGINKTFIEHWWRHKAEEIQGMGTGTTVQGIRLEDIRSLCIYLPPVNEQKCIADKLDTLLARVEACRARLDNMPRLLKRFRQAVLAAATSGELTADWREESDQESDWYEVSVAEVAASIFDGPFGSNLKTSDYTSNGVRVIRLENIGHLHFYADKETYISFEKYEGLRKHTLKPRDILFSSFIDDEIRVCLFPATTECIAINKADCFCIRTDFSRCIPEYLTIGLACKSTFMALEESIHGATRPRINLKQLKQLTVSLPTLLEQHEIVRRVETLFTYADSLEARYTAARVQLDRLTSALLEKAFRGELVSQDPNDEPAALLLERIRAVRSNDLKSSRRIKMERKAKVAPAPDSLGHYLMTHFDKESFTFDELREFFIADYELVKDAVFDMLSQNPPILRQVFDHDSQAMRFERVKP
ncbi:MAG TPA: restriction endonuclease subunit S [Armatimonadota bacterium]|nr:restriction endonuclease subunit S [Armatimonadota bacterium]